LRAIGARQPPIQNGTSPRGVRRGGSFSLRVELGSVLLNELAPALHELLKAIAVVRANGAKAFDRETELHHELDVVLLVRDGVELRLGAFGAARLYGDDDDTVADEAFFPFVKDP